MKKPIRKRLQGVLVLLSFSLAVSLAGSPAMADPGNSGSEASASDSPQINSESAICINSQTGQIYYQKDVHKKLYPASITKIMTGLLAVEKGKADDVVTIQPDIVKSQSKDYANVALQSGEQITQDQLMYTMFLASANDSAQAVAEHIGGSVENFVSMMNERAKALGAADSHFSNPNGLPDTNNVTSSFDMAVITRQAIQSPDLMKYFSAKSYVMQPTNKRAAKEEFWTLHKMMKNTRYYYKDVIAGKTGWETMSGYTLVTVAQRDGRTLICVNLKNNTADEAYEDARKLLDYSFAQTDNPSGPNIVTAVPSYNHGNAALFSADSEQPLSTSKQQKLTANKTPLKQGAVATGLLIGAFAVFAAVSAWVMHSKRSGKLKDL